MSSESFWRGVELLSGRKISTREQQQRTEVGVVDAYLASIGREMPGGLTRTNSSDPPDVVTKLDEAIIGVEVGRIVNGEALAATKALHQGKSVPGYKHPPELPVKRQSCVWALDEETLQARLESMIARKTEGVAALKPDVKLDKRWLVLELRDRDHDRGWTEIEAWAKRAKPGPHAFDLIGLVTSIYDPSVQRARSVTLYG